MRRVRAAGRVISVRNGRSFAMTVASWLERWIDTSVLTELLLRVRRSGAIPQEGVTGRSGGFDVWRPSVHHTERRAAAALVGRSAGSAVGERPRLSRRGLASVYARRSGRGAVSRDGRRGTKECAREVRARAGHRRTRSISRGEVRTSSVVQRDHSLAVGVRAAPGVLTSLTRRLPGPSSTHVRSTRRGVARS